MAADHEARTIKPFCRKTPVITPPTLHQPPPPSTNRLLLRRFSFRARFFSSLVFHSRLSRCPPSALSTPSLISTRFPPATLVLDLFLLFPFLFLFLFPSLVLSLISLVSLYEVFVSRFMVVVERHSRSRGNATLRKRRWYRTGRNEHRSRVCTRKTDSNRRLKQSSRHCENEIATETSLSLGKHGRVTISLDATHANGRLT